MEGVMSGEDILSFAPLHLSALQRPDSLLEWINSWWGQGKKVPLMPKDYFKKVKKLLETLQHKKGGRYLGASNMVSSYLSHILLQVT